MASNPEPVCLPADQTLREVVSAEAPADTLQPQPVSRLRSLDALRGFDMFWIIGGSGLIFALRDYVHTRPDAAGWQWLDWLAGQLHHRDWDGFAFLDLVFPLFLFISGVTMPFSIVRRQEAGEASWRLHARIARRAVLLIVLGMVVNGCLKLDWANARYPSVLGRIGLAYFFAALIVLHTRPRGQFVGMVLILLGYCAALFLIPVPGGSRGLLDIDHWLGGYIDQHVLPGKLYRGVHDPEGLFATIPAVATALLGAITGAFLRWRSESPGESRAVRFALGLGKLTIMVGVGVAFLRLGRLWDPYFPINKNMWSSSFVLYAGGWSLLFLSAFYLVIDVVGLWWWAFPFIIIGLNPITIYVVMNRLIDFKLAAHFLFDGVLKYVPDVTRPIWWSLSVLFIEWLFLFLLYRKKVFLRV